MNKRRRFRFTIITLLVLMTTVAVLLNHEIQRMKAIEKTVLKVKEWRGALGYGRRANMPSFLLNILPVSSTQDIKTVTLDVDTIGAQERPSLYSVKQTVIDPEEFEEVLGLGALDNLRVALLRGSAINYSVVSRICKSSSMEYCILYDGVGLSEEEIKSLKQIYPKVILEGEKTSNK